MPTRPKEYVKGCSEFDCNLMICWWLPQLVMLFGTAWLCCGCSFAMLCSSDNGDSNATVTNWHNASPEDFVQLIAEWGQHDLKYDENVVRCILSNEFAETCLYVSQKPLDTFIKRFEEDDNLLGQLAWYRNWEAGQSLKEAGMLDDDGNIIKSFRSTTLPVVKTASIFTNIHIRSEKLSALILFASEFDRPDAIKGLTPENLDGRWQNLFDWIKNNAPYFYYSKKHACYLLDQNAANKKEAVTWGRQKWPFPSTPLRIINEKEVNPVSVQRNSTTDSREFGVRGTPYT